MKINEILWKQKELFLPIGFPLVPFLNGILYNRKVADLLQFKENK
jgi:hypothetical protein